MQVYRSKDKKPEPLFKIGVLLNQLLITLVTDKGEHITNLFHENDYRINVKYNLDEHGYSTDWAEWNSDGSFKKFKDGVEIEL
jgi:hypothetical protein